MIKLKRLPGAISKEDAAFSLFAQIRKSMGCGSKPSLTQFPAIIFQMRDICRSQFNRHAAAMDMHTHGETMECKCDDCEFCRKNLGME